jgi:hypothetical protein
LIGLNTLALDLFENLLNKKANPFIPQNLIAQFAGWEAVEDAICGWCTGLRQLGPTTGKIYGGNEIRNESFELKLTVITQQLSGSLL